MVHSLNLERILKRKLVGSRSRFLAQIWVDSFPYFVSKGVGGGVPLIPYMFQRGGEVDKYSQHNKNRNARNNATGQGRETNENSR